MKSLKIVYEDEAITYRYVEPVKIDNIIEFATKIFHLAGTNYLLKYQTVMGTKTVPGDDRLCMILKAMNSNRVFYLHQAEPKEKEDTKELTSLINNQLTVSNTYDKLPTTPRKDLPKTNLLECILSCINYQEMANHYSKSEIEQVIALSKEEKAEFVDTLMSKFPLNPN